MIRFVSSFVATFLIVTMAGGCGKVEIPQISGKQGIDLSSYRNIELDISRVIVSSINQVSEGKENLIQGIGNHYWHVKFPKETAEEWVIVDLESAGGLAALAVRPRTGHLDQIWKGNTAILQGSNNKEQWIPLVSLRLDTEGLNEDVWIIFILPKEFGPYRYFRLFISDPNFLSLGGLEIYSKDGIPVVKPQ